MTDNQWPPLPPIQTGIRCKCPRCGQASMFDGFLTLKKKCEACDLDYSFADPADGPAFFVICFACVPSVFVGVWLEVQFQAALWVHALVTLPFMLATCIPPLRPLKGWLVASQFYHKAEQGQLVRLNDPDYKPQVVEVRNAHG